MADLANEVEECETTTAPESRTDEAIASPCRVVVPEVKVTVEDTSSEKPALAPPVFVFQKDKAQKRSADGSSPDDGDDSDRDDEHYIPRVKRERTSSLTQFPPSQSVSKNNVFMPSSFGQPSTGNSDSEPEEKSSVFRLKPPMLIHGQAPSAGLPSQKPKELQRSVLRPALLQAPQPKSFSPTVLSSGTNGVNLLTDPTVTGDLLHNTAVSRRMFGPEDKADESQNCDSSCSRGDVNSEKNEESVQEDFIFGRNLGDESEGPSDGQAAADKSSAPNYFLQCISPSSEKHQTTVSLSASHHPAQSRGRTFSDVNAQEDNSRLVNDTNNAEATSSKFVFGQNMSERVLSPPKCNELNPDSNKENAVLESGSESSSQEATPEKSNISESLAESAAAYTKATARKCLLEKVEVITGEEAESNVLQIQCKLFVFDKSSQSWVERGRGLLRLNDMASTDDGTLQSRLVMRTQGSLRLILNTKLWAQMQIDKASEKSIRITAMDTEDQGVKVFLLSASSKDTGQLYAALHHRILALRSRVEQEQEAKGMAPEPDIAQFNEEDSDDDDDGIAPSGSNGSGPIDEGHGQTDGNST
ncbi:ran-binding protein 3 isoform X2 [Ambystoma mexicanum]|uniref:ran-binding protein 3 isoform X2 n=1 Tax=Ambystoma mexicanum TaxID=8296 RepID=UPI0037E94F99